MSSKQILVNIKELTSTATAIALQITRIPKLFKGIILSADI